MKLRHLWLLLAVAVLLGACSKDDDNNTNNNPNQPGTESASGSVRSDTSGVITTPGGARVVVPMGAVPPRSDGSPGTMVFSIETNNEADVTVPTGETATSNIYQFGPEGFVFARPVEISIPVTEGGSGEYKIWRVNPTSGDAEFYGCDYDAEAGVVRAQTYVFSTWFVTRGAVGSDAWGCIQVNNLTNRWLNMCVASYTLTYPNQVGSLPETGASVLWAPGGHISWASAGPWYLPQGTYTICMHYEDPANPGQYLQETAENVTISAPWSSSNPTATDLTVGAFAAPTSGRCGCTPNATTSVGTGDIQVTLTWHLAAPGLDLDLWVQDPTEEWCYYGNGQAPGVTTTGGQLDRDNLCWGYENGRPENIYWTLTPPAGEYVVAVDWFSDCGNAGDTQDYTVRTVVQGVTRTFNGTIARETDMQEVTRFQIQGSSVMFLPPRDGVDYSRVPKPAKAH